jgi:hypothetical protein
MLNRLAVLAVVGSLVCGATQVEAAPRKARAPASLGTKIASRASRLVGVKNLRTVDKKVPDDCTGVARHAYTSVGIDVMAGTPVPGANGVTHIYRYARQRGALHKKQPRPGDLVFFRETHDRNGDGRRNDGLTHVGVVESVSRSGLVTFVHRGSKGVARARMFLAEPGVHTLPGRKDVLNDYLRRGERGEKGRLTGELFVGYASPGPLAKRAPKAVARR